MDSFYNNINHGADNYSALALMGFMTVAVMIALVLIALSVRVVRSLMSAKAYEQALEKVDEIEQQLQDMITLAQDKQKEYDEALTTLRDVHAREVFTLQQTVFERNSEIIDLKTELQKITS